VAVSCQLTGARVRAVAALRCVASSHRRLRAYQLAVDLAREIRSEVLRWSAFDRDTLGSQLVRAIESVGANIAEAQGRWYAADKRRLLYVARGSLYEAEHWLTRAEESGLMRRGSAEELDELARALNGLIKKPIPQRPADS
jgi:four helix bundle protein